MVKIPIHGGCVGGEFQMQHTTKETFQMETDPNDKSKYCKIRYVMGHSVPNWSNIESGYLAYLEFDILWRPKYASSCRIVSLFAKSVLSIREMLHNYKDILVFPLKEEINENRDVYLKLVNNIIVSTFSKRDRDLASILLSISQIYVDLVVLELDAGCKSEIVYKVKKTFPISTSFHHPDLKSFKILFPFNFINHPNDIAKLEKKFAFVISSRIL